MVPPNLAHTAVNTSSSQEAVVHVAMPTESPSRTLVDKFFSRRGMPVDSPGKEGAEHVTRHRTARRVAAGGGASFIDYFNRDLVPGIEMSGGYGLFQPGGRLLAHFHDFDESICIIEGRGNLCRGRATGTRFPTAPTALAAPRPRPLLHQSVPGADGHDLGVWRPVPERLVVAEHNCTVEGNPWKSR